VSNPGQALAAAALAAARGVPVLLAEPGVIPVATQSALAGVGAAVTVVAGPEVPDTVLAASLGGRTFDRLSGADARAGAVAVAGAFPAQSSNAWLMPDTASTWAAVPALAATGAPILFTTQAGLSSEAAGYLTGRAGLAAVATVAGEHALADTLLGAASRLLVGLVPPPANVVPVPTPSVSVASPPPVTATATRTVGRANAGPEPVKRGATVSVRSRLRARYSDGVWRAAPAGVPFTVYFRAAGTRRWTAAASGVSAAGVTVGTAKATRSGYWRVKVGSKYSASDYVKVRR
jgi:hypothetical protein